MLKYSTVVQERWKEIQPEMGETYVIFKFAPKKRPRKAFNGSVGQKGKKLEKYLRKQGQQPNQFHGATLVNESDRREFH